MADNFFRLDTIYEHGITAETLARATGYDAAFVGDVIASAGVPATEGEDAQKLAALVRGSRFSPGTRLRTRSPPRRCNTRG